jgi:hypothetical protein
MGMVLSLCTLSDLTIARVLTDPPLIWRVVAPDDPEAYGEARARQERRGCLAGLFGRKPVAAPAVPPPALDLGETKRSTPTSTRRGMASTSCWHGLGREPHRFPAAGADGLRRPRHGPRVFSSADVRRIHAVVAAISDEELARRYSPAAMTEADIYPRIWDRPPEVGDAREYVMSYVATLREFLTDASKRGMGMLVYLS